MQPPQPRLGDVLARRQRRRNVRALFTYVALIVGIVALYWVLFHVIMWHVEGQRLSWITGLYWTLSTMSTLGVGDVVFTSDLGRLFTVVVLISGILLFLIVLPFSFIRYFYAPWLETPRLPARMAGHVIIVGFDNIAQPLIEKLELHNIRYYVVEPDPIRAAKMFSDGVSVVAGAIDDRATYDRLKVASARLVLANCADTTNTNVTLTVREAAPSVPIAAVAESEASTHILTLAGVTQVIPLKQRLGEQLANRLNAGHAQTHVIGSFRDLLIAELAVHHTPFVGRAVRDIRLGEDFGVSILGVLQQARFVPASAETRLTEHSVPVVLGTRKQIEALDEFLVIYDANYSPALVIGGGEVGRAATRMLKRNGIAVHVIDRGDISREWAGDTPDRLFIGDAAERKVLMEAGLAQAPGVLLTTNDDAMNIYLALHCRRLAPEVRIVSRITHDRNMTAIRRAGADIALSHTSLGVAYLFAALRGHELVVLGEGVELHELPLPARLAGKTLGQAAIATRTGLNVIAIQESDRLITNPDASTLLQAASSLLMIGDQSQLTAFMKAYE
jgi:voltage-gated potassium channel